MVGSREVHKGTVIESKQETGRLLCVERKRCELELDGASLTHSEEEEETSHSSWFQDQMEPLKVPWSGLTGLERNRGLYGWPGCCVVDV